VRRFRRGEQVQYAYKLINPAPGVTVSVRLYRGREMVLESPPKQLSGALSSNGKRLLVEGGLRLVKELAPGDYFMEVLVNRGGVTEAEQWVDFELLPEVTSPAM
jgi:hypothetical protein